MVEARNAPEPRVVFWLPGLAAHGGIQRHNRLLCRVISDWCQQRGGSLHVVSLLDPPGWRDDRYLDKPLVGANGRSAGFAFHAMRSLIGPTDLLIIGIKDFGPLVPVARLRRPSMPILSIAHGIEVWTRLSAPERLTFSAASRIFCVSNDTARAVIEVQGARPDRVVVIPTPLDPAFVSGFEDFVQADEAPIFSDLLSISRVDTADVDKGVDTVIRALPAIRGEIGPVRYTVVGDGSDLPRLRRLATEAGVDDCVEFAGRVPDGELHARLAGTKVFVLPSAKEGFGIVYLEAMLHGRPVIAGAHGGAPEVVDDSHTGRLVSRDDVPGVARACIDLLASSSLRAKYGAAGAEQARQRFLAPVFAQRIRRLLTELTESS